MRWIGIKSAIKLTKNARIREVIVTGLILRDGVTCTCPSASVTRTLARNGFGEITHVSPLADFPGP